MAQAPHTTYEVIWTLGRMEAIEAEWNALFARSALPTQAFLSFNWNWHWAQTFLGATGPDAGNAMVVMTARQNGRLVLVWPLVLERSRGIRKLRWMGAPLTQYGDVLVDDVPDRNRLISESFDVLLHEVPADLLWLRKVRADAVIAPFLDTLGSLRSAVAEAPYMDLQKSQTYEDFEMRYPAKARKNRRRLMRRLAELGPIHVEQHTDGSAAGQLARQAVAMKQVWLAGRGIVSPALKDPRTAAFFQSVATARHRPVGLRVSVLKVADRPAAIELSLACKRRLLVHLIAYDVGLSRYGPGCLHMQESIRSAIDQGFETFDLLPPNDPYKFAWADKSIAVCDHAVATSLPGRAYARLYLPVRTRLKKVAQTMPEHWLNTVGALSAGPQNEASAAA